MSTQYQHGINFETVEGVQVGDIIYLCGSGVSITVTDRMPPLRKGNKVVQRSVIGRVDYGSNPIPGFNHGTICVLMVTHDSLDQTLIPLEALVYGLEEKPKLTLTH